MALAPPPGSVRAGHARPGARAAQAPRPWGCRGPAGGNSHVHVFQENGVPRSLLCLNARSFVRAPSPGHATRATTHHTQSHRPPKSTPTHPPMLTSPRTHPFTHRGRPTAPWDCVAWTRNIPHAPYFFHRAAAESPCARHGDPTPTPCPPVRRVQTSHTTPPTATPWRRR